MEEFFIFNTPLELGLRCLHLLTASYPHECSIDRLIYFDYLTLYTKDSSVSSNSLHPEYPLRAVEVFVRRETIKQGLLLMSAKCLIGVNYNENGVFYCANSNTSWFLRGLSGAYSEKLSEKSKLIVEHFKKYTDREIEEFINGNIKVWGDEFENYFSVDEEVE